MEGVVSEARRSVTGSSIVWQRLELYMGCLVVNRLEEFDIGVYRDVYVSVVVFKDVSIDLLSGFALYNGDDVFRVVYNGVFVYIDVQNDVVVYMVVYNDVVVCRVV